MSDELKSTDDIRQELQEMGIDYHAQIDWCRAVSHVDAYYDQTKALQTDDAISPDLRRWAAAQFEDVTLEPEVISARLWKMFSIVLVSIGAFAVMSVSLFLGFFSEEPWRYVAQAAIIISAVLAIVGTLTALQLLWAGYVRERSLRYEAVENLRLARDLLHSAC